MSYNNLISTNNDNGNQLEQFRESFRTFKKCVSNLTPEQKNTLRQRLGAGIIAHKMSSEAKTATVLIKTKNSIEFLRPMDDYPDINTAINNYQKVNSPTEKDNVIIVQGNSSTTMGYIREFSKRFEFIPRTVQSAGNLVADMI